MRLTIKTPTREFEYTSRQGAANIVIGNRSYDEVCINDDPEVSGPHVRLEFFIGKWTFSDQFSNAGTVHNGSKKSSGELAQGDVLTLGGTTITVTALADDLRDATSFAVSDPKPSSTSFAPPGMPAADTAWPPPAQAQPAPLPDVVSSAAGEPDNAQVTEQLFAALLFAARREDGIEEGDHEALREYRALADFAIRHMGRDRALHVYIPLLLSGDAMNFDIEDEIKGELQGSVDDLSSSERTAYDFLIAQASRLAGRDVSLDRLARERLADAASDLDNAIANGPSAEVRVPWLTTGPNGAVHLCVKVSKFGGNFRVDAALPPPPEPPPAPPGPSAEQLLKQEEQSWSSSPEAPAANAVFVRRIEALLARTFISQHGIDPRRDSQSAKRLTDAARKAVVELESTRTTDVNLPFLASDAGGPKHLQLTVQRWHLHERAEDEQQPHRTAPSERNPSEPRTSGSSAKKGSPAILVGVVAVLILAIGIAVVSESISESDNMDAVKQEVERSMAVSEKREEVRKAIREASKSDSNVPPEEQMRLLLRLAADIKEAGLDLDSDMDRAIKGTLQRIHAALSRRYQNTALDVRLAIDAGSFVKADSLRSAFMTHVQDDPYRREEATRRKIDDWNNDRVAEITEGNNRLLATKFEAADDALALNQFAAAAIALEDVVAGAIMPMISRSALKAEADTVRHKAIEQERGEREPPLKRLPDPPKLPSFPRNDLLPLGGTTAARNLSALRQKVTDAFRKGETATVAATYRGYECEVSAVEKSSQVRVLVKRPLTRVVPPPVLEFEVRATVQQLPDDTQFGLMRALPNKTVADWLGLLHFCFDRGLADKAGEVALQIRWLDPEHQRELDELLAAKWAKPIPTGGFPERDGRVVPE